MNQSFIRLDVLLTAKKLADSRSRAQEMIRSGVVFVDGKCCDKPSASFPENTEPEIRGDFCPYVSRGGLKLQKALEVFGIDPCGYVCSDSGASTGGFTDCLLQHGAKKVYAIDVGTGQLADKLRRDPRVMAMEQTNIRYLTPEALGEHLDFSVVDVSFISLKLVLPAIYGLLKEEGQAVCLIKPQFEAGKAHVGKKGVVKDRKVHKRVLDEFLLYTDLMGFSVQGLTFSPVTGPEGNIEFLGYLKKTKGRGLRPDTEAVVASAHAHLKG